MEFTDIIKKAYKDDCIIPAFNVFGYEDSMAVVHAAEKLKCPVMLMTNRDAVHVLEVEVWGAMLSEIAKSALVPVGVHLDHCADEGIIYRAIESGYSSVMYDGSQLPFEENIVITKRVADYAHAKNIAVEGEIGSVPYSDKPEAVVKAEITDPRQAEEFARQTGIDWMAISIGNVHKLCDTKVKIDFGVLEEIEALTDVPLVIHGASGIADADIRKLRTHRIGKINIGTAIRYVFGNTLRKTMEQSPEVFDRLELISGSVKAVEEKTSEIIQLLCQ